MCVWCLRCLKITKSVINSGSNKEIWTRWLLQLAGVGAISLPAFVVDRVLEVFSESEQVRSSEDRCCLE